MSNEELAAAIAAFILAHGAATATVLYKAITLAVKKLIEWERLLARVQSLEDNRVKDLEALGATIEKLNKDINAAHSKLRS